MTNDILQQIEDIKKQFQQQQKVEKQIEKASKKEPTKRKAQLSVSSFIFITLILIYAIDYVVGDIFVAYLVFHFPENISPSIEEYIRSILKMYINIHYACKDHVGMMLSGCLAWFFKGKIDEKDKQLLEKQITALEEQKHCSQCGKEM